MSNYLQVPTRLGPEGAMDKAAIIQSLAVWTAQTNRDFLNLVREVVKNCQTAEEQVNTWFAFCCSRTYSREYGDVFANPQDTANRGGDCDDLTILCLSGLHALGIPACPDVVMKEDPLTKDKQGVHVRVRCGLPPHDPPADVSKWIILDPARESEKRWVGAKKDLYDPKMTVVTSGSYTKGLMGLAGVNPGALGDGSTTVTTDQSADRVVESKEKFPIKEIAILGGLAVALISIRAWFSVYRKDVHDELIPAFRK